MGESPRREKSFWDWHTAVKTDLGKLPSFLRGSALKTDIQRLFLVELTQDELRLFASGPSLPATPAPKAAPIIAVASARTLGEQ